MTWSRSVVGDTMVVAYDDTGGLTAGRLVTMLRMIRRVAPSEVHRGAEDDGDVLRYAASCANEMVDAAGLPLQRAQLALKQAAQRYVRVLGLTSKELADALQAEIQASADPSSLKLPEGTTASSVPRATAAGEAQTAE